MLLILNCKYLTQDIFMANIKKNIYCLAQISTATSPNRYTFAVLPNVKACFWTSKFCLILGYLFIYFVSLSNKAGSITLHQTHVFLMSVNVLSWIWNLSPFSCSLLCLAFLLSLTWSRYHLYKLPMPQMYFFDVWKLFNTVIFISMSPWIIV